MNRGIRHHLLIVTALGLCSPGSAQELQSREIAFTPNISIKELMEKTITPATNTIWNAYEPPSTDAQWEALEEAAITLLAAAKLNELGGTGASDNDWVLEPTWKAFNAVMSQAGSDALDAIRTRDHEALLAASDVLYPPCEGCHQQFNPGVVDAP